VAKTDGNLCSFSFRVNLLRSSTVRAHCSSGKADPLYLAVIFLVLPEHLPANYIAKHPRSQESTECPLRFSKVLSIHSNSLFLEGAEIF
jgi:hypothetical protein